MPKKIKILLVEDNEDERLFMKEGFISSGLYEVIAEASNGDEMLDLFRQDSFRFPEMVVTDLNMPGKNGYEILQEVKSDQALCKIPVVVLTTAPYVPYADRCKKLGACAYFTKPDTFLDYENFAMKMYGEVTKGCLSKD